MQYTYTRWRHYCTLVVTAVRLPTTDLVYSWIAIQSWYYSSFIRQTEARASTQPQAAVKPPRSGFDVPWIALEPRSDPDWELTTSEMKIWWREAPKEEYLAGFFPFFFFAPPPISLTGKCQGTPALCCSGKGDVISSSWRAGSEQGREHCLLVVKSEQWVCI